MNETQETIHLLAFLADCFARVAVEERERERKEGRERERVRERVRE